jgi:hypothetical protein
VVVAIPVMVFACPSTRQREFFCLFFFFFVRQADPSKARRKEEVNELGRVKTALMSFRGYRADF